jgi:hypothetical protein
MLPLRTEKTLEWIKENTISNAGVRAWPGGPAYPEVTGYLIPTLLKYGENELAQQYANWLISIQRDNGSFPGLDGQVSRIFDTAACVEGLVFFNMERAELARNWIKSYAGFEGKLPEFPGGEYQFYTIRANWIAGIPISYELPHFHGRLHYIAYALEGLSHFEEYKEYVGQLLRDLKKDVFLHGLVPYSFTGENYLYATDVCATAQLAILMLQYEVDAHEQIEAIRNVILPNGGVPQAGAFSLEIAWGAKFYLDLAYVLNTIGSIDNGRLGD